MNKQKSIIAALAILFAGQAFALDAANSNAASTAITLPHEMTLSHELVNMLRERDLNMIERRLIRPFARPIKGNDLIARVTARDQAEADWMVTALRQQGATAEIVTLVSPNVPNVMIDVSQIVTDTESTACPEVAAEQNTAPDIITWRHDFVAQLDVYYEHNFEISTIRDAARTMRTPAVESVNITARDQAEADRVAFEYRRFGATAPFTTTIDPAIAEVRMDIVKASQQ